tara:strand:- start:76 stop:795 length:720 start_codon:yes stop_codon:yes gene_type:complete
MAFKMKGFSYPGKAPLKQVVDYTAGMTGADDLQRKWENEQYQKLLEEQNNLLKKQNKKEREQDLIDNAPWSDNIKDKHKEKAYNPETGETTGDDLKEGWDYTGGTDFTDPSVDRYKSKEEIKQDKKTRKLKSKLNKQTEEGKFLGLHTGVTKQYTKKEKHSDKMAYLADKYQRARGTGEMGVSFDWRNMLLGGLAEGFKVEPKKDILARKIKKKEQKFKAKETKRKAKEERKKLRNKKK